MADDDSFYGCLDMRPATVYDLEIATEQIINAFRKLAVVSALRQYEEVFDEVKALEHEVPASISIKLDEDEEHKITATLDGRTHVVNTFQGLEPILENYCAEKIGFFMEKVFNLRYEMARIEESKHNV